jgi:hypothetical protein
VPGVVVFNRTTSTILRAATAAVSAGSKTATGEKDSVSLRDGNRFAGMIRGIDPAKGLVLQREGLPDLELMEEELTTVTFADREKATVGNGKASADGGKASADGGKAARPRSRLRIRLQTRR